MAWHTDSCSVYGIIIKRFKETVCGDQQRKQKTVNLFHPLHTNRIRHIYSFAGIGK